MVRAGIIVGAVGFVLVLGSAVIISPLCTLCWGLILGLAAGYLAGVYEKPANNNDTLKKGAIAGAIAAGLVMLGALIGGIINAAILEPADIQQMYELLGIDLTLDQTSLWVGQLGAALCGGLLNIVLMAGFGALGGILWWQIQGKKRPTESFPEF
jgi:MFS family permease